MGSHQDIVGRMSSLERVPKIKADQQLRAFRQEAQLSWLDFNFLWAELCHYLNSPANDILLNIELIGTSDYDQTLSTITGDLLASGVFGSKRPGTWRYGLYQNEEDMPA